MSIQDNGIIMTDIKDLPKIAPIRLSENITLDGVTIESVILEPSVDFSKQVIYMVVYGELNEGYEVHYLRSSYDLALEALKQLMENNHKGKWKCYFDGYKYIYKNDYVEIIPKNII